MMVRVKVVRAQRNKVSVMRIVRRSLRGRRVGLGVTSIPWVVCVYFIVLGRFGWLWR